MIKDLFTEEIDEQELYTFIECFDSEKEAENFLKNEMHLVSAKDVMQELYVYVKSEYNCGNKSLKETLKVMAAEMETKEINESLLWSYMYLFPCNFEPCFLLKDKTKCYVMDNAKIIGD